MMTEEDALSITDEESGDSDDLGDSRHPSVLAGTLSKWTNYINGWQDRYFLLENGIISYFKSESEMSIGCRGSVSLSKAVISGHEFDECRFDIGVNDCIWYLRSNSSEDRWTWMDALEKHKAESGYGSQNSLQRRGSKLSLTSTASLSTASTSSFNRGHGLREKLNEMETFKDILCRQVDSLQNYFDACASTVIQKSVHDLDSEDLNDFENQVENEVPQIPKMSFDPIHRYGSNDILSIFRQHGAHAIDFKGESYTFKATTAGILATLSHCLDLMSQREESWKKRVEKEIEKRKKLEESYKRILSERSKPIVLGGPDFEEGPHSMMKEEEFYDAVDAALDRQDREDEQKLLQISYDSSSVAVSRPETSLESKHPLYPEICQVVNDHMAGADMSANDVSNTWTLIASEGEMKVYKKEMNDAKGDTVYTLKAVHTVTGITGHELCHYFWDPSVKMEWEATLDSTQVMEWLSQDTIVNYQILKRMWPTAQRDSLYWSTVRHYPSEDDEGPDYWIVVNHSTDHADSPPNAPKCVRINFNVAMIGQTVVQPPVSGQPITRDGLTCKIQYSACVNPGGWVPASVIQVICKREAPKFLKTFTAYVQEKTKDKPIML